MAINFASDGGTAGKALTPAQRQRLIEEKELVQDRISSTESALYYLGQAEIHLEIDEIGRQELVKLGKEKA